MTTTSIEPLSPEWHERRRVSITGTDVPAILGVSKFRSPMDVWARITGKVEDVFTGNAYTEWGNETEDTNRRLLAKRFGYEVTDSVGLCVDDEFDWLVSTPDGLIASARRDRLGVWEGKSPTHWTAGEWVDDHVPVAYQVQTQVNMRVMDLDWGVVSALIPPSKPDDVWLRAVPVEFDERFHDAMMDEVQLFRDQYVLKDTPPPATARDLGCLKLLHPEPNGRAVFLAPQVQEAWAVRATAKASIREYTAIVKAQDATIIQALGDEEYGILPDGKVVANRLVSRYSEARGAKLTSSRQMTTLKELPAGIEVAS
jgi:putative phage-type endonuclease